MPPPAICCHPRIPTHLASPPCTRPHLTQPTHHQTSRNMENKGHSHTYARANKHTCTRCSAASTARPSAPAATVVAVSASLHACTTQRACTSRLSEALPPFPPTHPHIHTHTYTHTKKDSGPHCVGLNQAAHSKAASADLAARQCLPCACQAVPYLLWLQAEAKCTTQCTSSEHFSADQQGDPLSSARMPCVCLAARARKSTPSARTACAGVLQR